MTRSLSDLRPVRWTETKFVENPKDLYREHVTGQMRPRKNLKVETVKTGRFHQWGQSSEAGDDGSVGTDSVAIIECDDGTVHLIYPGGIQFLDREVQGDSA